MKTALEVLREIKKQTAASLLDELCQRGILIWRVGNRLRFKPRSAVDPELREQLVRYKPQLLEALNREVKVPLLREKVTATGGYSVSLEVVEIVREDRQAPRRWERRATSGAAVIVTDRTSDPAVARLWVRALEPAEKARAQ